MRPVEAAAAHLAVAVERQNGVAAASDAFQAIAAIRRLPYRCGRH
jgi:hypothetical protein